MQNDMRSYNAAKAGQLRVLVVDGAAAGRAFLDAALRESYQVIVADTADAAREIIYANQGALSLIVLDMALPDGQSAAILRQVNEDPVLMHIPVITMSTEPEDEIATLEGGAMDFIRKPCAVPGVLLARVRRCIELSENRHIIRTTERDQLTGLYNRDFFFSYVEQYDTYHRELPMDAIMVNISHFHMINERHGKAYGDNVLKRVGGKLRDCLADRGAIVCRRHSDTFLVYCPHIDDYQAVLDAVASGMDKKVRLRMGVYPNVDKALEVDRRFDRAKLASDTIRGSFTQTVALYDDKLRKSEIYTEQLLDDFPRAIEQKEFVVYYQPKFAIQATMPVLNSAEALVRWVHPQLGLISPGDFIPLFESNGLIRRLDSYVWREVAAQMRDWKDRLGVCVPVSVNVSRVDMFDYDLVDHMKALIAEFGLSPDEFLLEITESAYTQDAARIINTVKELRHEGFHIEIDDFGSGYSSLNMISSLPMDALKLDMEFMHNAFKERRNTKMLDAVIDIACSLEVPTIAEGVETAEQMFALKEMGCDVVQGYYFSRPLPAKEYERYLLEMKNGRSSTGDADREARIKAAEQFAYEALHDPLTGLYNHSAYSILLKDADQRNIALLLADLDGYEALKEAEGEDTANRTLELVAHVLRHSFRSVDFICRIGVDEFAIIMTRMNNAMKSLINEKVEHINAMLEKERGDLPPVSLSVGVAFADRENPQGDIFQDADMMLQRVKAVRQSGCEIY